MGLLDRIILTIYTFAFTFLSFAAIVIAVGWDDPFVYLSNFLQDVNGRWTIGVLGTVFFISSIRLLYFAFRRSQSAKTVIHQTDLGQVQVSLHAVESLINRLVRQQKGVRDVRSEVSGEPSGVHVSLRLWVAPDTSIPTLAETLQSEIERSVRNVVGIGITALDLNIENITTESRRTRVE